jgi:hypothetical protein
MALVGIIFIGVKPLSGTGGRWMENRMFLGRSKIREICYVPGKTLRDFGCGGNMMRHT